MSLKDRLRRAYRYNVTLIVYFFVGGICALVEWAVFAVCHFAVGIHYVIAAVAGLVVGTFVNYLLSSRYTFFSRGRTAAQELGLVYLVSVLAFSVNLAVMLALMSWTGMSTMAAKVLGTGAAFFWNYALRQFMVFDRVPPTWRQFHERLPLGKRHDD